MIRNKILGKVTQFGEKRMKTKEWRTDLWWGGGGAQCAPLGFIGLKTNIHDERVCSSSTETTAPRWLRNTWPNGGVSGFNGQANGLEQSFELSPWTRWTPVPVRVSKKKRKPRFNSKSLKIEKKNNFPFFFF